MKSLICSVLLALSMCFMLPITHAAETKLVCIDKVDKGKPVLDKAGKPVQVCKQVKQHAKLEGTKVPDKK